MSNLALYKLLIVMICIACLTGFATDIYIPSFLAISQDLAASTEYVQRSMSVYIFAVSISQLIYGPLSEIIGRHKPLMIGTLIVLIGSVICYFATNINFLFLGRFIQGLGAGACSCLWRPILRDTLNQEQIAKYGGYLGIIMVFIVAAAPAIGGYLENYFNWRVSFIAIGIYALTLLILIYVLLPETNIHHHSDRRNISFIKNSFIQLLTSRIFMGYSLCVFLTYGALFSWFVTSSVLLIDNLNIKPTDFGLINLLLGSSAMVLGATFNGKMINKLGSISILRLGWGLIFISGSGMLIWNNIYAESSITLIFFIFVFLFGATLIWPNTFAGAFAPFGAIAGYAGSLYSCMQLGGGAVIGWLCTFMPLDNSNYLALIFMITSLLSWVIFERIINKNLLR